jgi:hypothetical protein
METHNLDEPTKRKNAAAVARAISGGRFWMELPWWRRLGLAMLWVGVGALSIALVYKTPTSGYGLSYRCCVSLLAPLCLWPVQEFQPLKHGPPD